MRPAEWLRGETYFDSDATVFAGAGFFGFQNAGSLARTSADT
jgi:hypothetical protein